MIYIANRLKNTQRKLQLGCVFLHLTVLLVVEIKEDAIIRLDLKNALCNVKIISWKEGFYGEDC